MKELYEFGRFTLDVREGRLLCDGQPIPLKPKVLETLVALGEGYSPTRQVRVFAGYAGWSPGQLEKEMSDNGWLTVPADPEIVFDPSIDDKWRRAMGKLGINPSLLSGAAGHA